MKTVFAFALLSLTSCLPDKLVRVRQGRTNYLAPSAAEDSLDKYNNQASSSSTGSAARSLPAPEPIAIRSQSFEPEASGAFRYAFEGENELKQKAEGSLRTVGEAEVVVMKGEYSYIGEDGNEWKVEWFADETGFHPSAPFLPKSVEPNHPEVAAAVRAQLEFAASEEAGAGAGAVAGQGAVGGEGAGAASSEHAYLAPPLPLAAYNA